MCVGFLNNQTWYKLEHKKKEKRAYTVLDYLFQGVIVIAGTSM